MTAAIGARSNRTTRNPWGLIVLDYRQKGGLRAAELVFGAKGDTMRFIPFLQKEIMGARSRSVERRRPGRPQNGDAKSCPNCGKSNCEFNERYRFEDVGIAPAWVCDSPRCGHRELVRGAGRPAAARAAIRSSLELQARVKRQMMKARSLTERSQKRLAGRGRRKA
jgi:hypothetical protein